MQKMSKSAMLALANDRIEAMTAAVRVSAERFGPALEHVAKIPHAPADIAADLQRRVEILGAWERFRFDVQNVGPAEALHRAVVVAIDDRPLSRGMKHVVEEVLFQHGLAALIETEE